MQNNLPVSNDTNIAVTVAPETKSITCFDLWTYLQEIQAAILEGYRLSESNEHFPQGYVGLYTCGMVKPVYPKEYGIDEPNDVAKGETNVAQSETPADKPKVQRKSKAKEV